MREWLICVSFVFSRISSSYGQHLTAVAEFMDRQLDTGTYVSSCKRYAIASSYDPFDTPPTAYANVRLLRNNETARIKQSRPGLSGGKKQKKKSERERERERGRAFRLRVPVHAHPVKGCSIETRPRISGGWRLEWRIFFRRESRTEIHCRASGREVGAEGSFMERRAIRNLVFKICADNIYPHCVDVPSRTSESAGSITRARDIYVYNLI